MMTLLNNARRRPEAGFPRRHFLRGLALAAVSGVFWPEHLLADVAEPAKDRFGTLLPARALGKTGQKITILGLGGQHFHQIPQAQLQECIDTAIEGGIRFFDTARNYGRDQLSERLYGKHLVPKYRNEVFLMTKSAARDASTARRDLDDSLKNLRTDVLDLWQMHTLEDDDDVQRRWDNGVVDVFLEARAKGKVRHIGFTGHKQPAHHLNMLKMVADRGLQMDSVQMPVNVCDPAFSSFIKDVMPVALKQGVSVLAMKTMCGGRMFGGVGEGWGPRGRQAAEGLVPKLLSLADAADYVWSLPVSTRIVGYDNLTQLREHIAAARRFSEITTAQQARILATAATLSGPVMEYYKRNTLPGAKEDRF